MEKKEKEQASQSSVVRHEERWRAGALVNVGGITDEKSLATKKAKRRREEGREALRSARTVGAGA